MVNIVIMFRPPSITAKDNDRLISNLSTGTLNVTQFHPFQELVKPKIIIAVFFGQKGENKLMEVETRMLIKLYTSDS